MTVYGDKTSMATRPAAIRTTSSGSAGAAAGAPHRIGYGEHVVFGLYSLVTVYQGDLVVLYEIERGPIEEYVTIELGGVDMPVAGGTVGGIYLEAPKKGEAAQAVSTLLSTIFADHVERYPCHAYLVARFDAAAIVGGSIPECRCVVKGRKDVYDPRTATSGYTDTPALCAAHLVAAPEGGQTGSAGIVWGSVEDVADWQETVVSGAKRYAIAGLISTRGMISQHVRAILSQSASWESRSAEGLWRIGCENAAAAAVATIESDWLFWADGKNLPREWATSADEQTTRQIVTFSDASRDWEIAEAIAELDGVAAGDEPLYQKTLEAPWISSREVAQRLAEDTLELAQAGYRVQVTCNMKALALEQGDVVSTSGVFGVPDGTWTVLAAQLSIRAGVTLTLAQRPGNSISAPASEEKTTPPVPRVGEIPPAPTGLTLSVLESAAAGKVVYTIVAEVDPPASVIVRTLVFQLYEAGSWRTVATQDAASDRVARFHAIGPGDNDVRVWSISHSGQWSATAASDTVTCGPGIGAYPAVVRGNVNKPQYRGPFEGTDGTPNYTTQINIYEFALSDPSGIVQALRVYWDGKLLGELPPTATEVRLGIPWGSWHNVDFLVYLDNWQHCEIKTLAFDGTETPSTGSWSAGSNDQVGLYQLETGTAPQLMRARFDAVTGLYSVGPVDVAAPPADGQTVRYNDAIGDFEYVDFPEVPVAHHTVILRTDYAYKGQMGTSAADVLEKAFPAFTLPTGATIVAAALTLRLSGYNSYSGRNYLNGGSIQLKKDSGAYSSFITFSGPPSATLYGAAHAAQNAPIVFSVTEGDVTSVVNGSGTYTAKLDNATTAQNYLEDVGGWWELVIVYVL